MVPEWKLPNSFPDLSQAKALSIDIETRDPHLKELGPGVRRDGYIVGVAISTSDKEFSAYYPVAHDEGPNLNKEAVFDWLNDELSDPRQIKIGTNLQYDIDYLQHAGVNVRGPIYDIMIAEPLLDENAVGKYGLDAQAQKYLGKPKGTTILEQECERRGYKGKPQEHIWRLHAKYSGGYAIEDTLLPIDILRKQISLLKQQDLWELFQLETGLTPLLLQMRRTGVRINEKELPRVTRELKARLVQSHAELNNMAGMEVNYNAAASLAEACDRLGISYGLTKKTQKPSFTTAFMKDHPEQFIQKVMECRKLGKFIGTFFEGALARHMIAGRIHGSFNQLKSDEYGTVSGRFSASNPNLQQIPKRDKELAPLVRRLFLPEEGCDWGKADYSQVEYRLLAHFAVGDAGDVVRAAYAANPRMDIHEWAAGEAGIDRDPAKTLNFMIIYGGGKKKVAGALGLNEEEAEAFLDNYHTKVPFAKDTLKAVSDVATRRGYIKTILNRRRRFVFWSPNDRQLSEVIRPNRDPSVIRRAIQQYIRQDKYSGCRTGVGRHAIFTALNALLQGSSADIIKKAMRDGYDAGIFDVLIPHLTVHDELDVSVPRTKEGREAMKEMCHMMATAVDTRVPLLVEPEIGPNWADVEEMV